MAHCDSAHRVERLAQTLEGGGEETPFTVDKFVFAG